MNRLGKSFSSAKEAQIRYLDADYVVVKTGEFVRCGVTGHPIPLDDLKYWSVVRQEAYVDAQAAFQRMRDAS